MSDLGEKLGEIKARVDYVEKGYAETEWAESVRIGDLRWLIAQAERAKKLEEFCIKLLDHDKHCTEFHCPWIENGFTEARQILKKEEE